MGKARSRRRREEETGRVGVPQVRRGGQHPEIRNALSFDVRALHEEVRRRAFVA